MAKYDYNIAVLGAGSAGLVTAYIGAAIKAKVALFEKHKMGGDCLNTGCVPSKSLIKSARAVHQLRKGGSFGISNVSFDFDFAQAMEETQKVIAKIEPHDSVERYTGLGVDCITGAAKILSAHELECEGKRYTAKSIVIAAGASPRIPPIPGLDEMGVLTSENIWNVRELPKKIVFVGGGPIGCELAQCFARFGSEVTIMDMVPTLLPREDPEIAKYVIESLGKDGVNFIGECKIERFELADGQKRVHYSINNQQQQIDCDQIFMGIGRQANVKGYGLEELGIVLTPAGTIQIDKYCRTGIKNIYACGDVAGPYQFTHTAAHQAWYCAVNALFSPLKKFAVDYSVIPWVTFTDPEVAHVGLNEPMAKAQNVEYEITRYGLDDLDRAIADRADYGLVKVLTQPKTDKVLGATIVGANAGEVIGEFILAMRHKLGLEKILGTIHPYPTWIEANKYLAGNWKREHAPQSVLNILQRFHGLRR